VFKVVEVAFPSGFVGEKSGVLDSPLSRPLSSARISVGKQMELRLMEV